MKRLWLTGVALTVLVAGPATAADMPVKAPLYRAPPPPLFYNWTGFYVGLNGGYAFGRESVDPNVVSGACDNPLGCPQILALLSGGQSINPSGFTGGLQIGYNLQFGNFLLG